MKEKDWLKHGRKPLMAGRMLFLIIKDLEVLLTAATNKDTFSGRTASEQHRWNTVMLHRHLRDVVYLYHVHTGLQNCMEKVFKPFELHTTFEKFCPKSELSEIFLGSFSEQRATQELAEW